MNQKIIEGLAQIGLTKTETKVYLTLLELGEALTGTIASKANLYRKNVYDALNNLHKKGLVSFVVKSNRKYWKALDPKKIESIINEKSELVKSIIPELSEKFKTKIKRKEVIYFEGLQGMKSFYDDMYKENKNIYVIGATGKAYTKLKYFIHSWNKKMNKLRINIYALWNSDSMNREAFIRELKSKNKILPKNFLTPTQIFIYGNKSAIVVWSEEPLSILIKSKEIAKGFKKYFSFMWNLSKDIII
jgi:sugar-specific transcriptional regulator TrmB